MNYPVERTQSENIRIARQRANAILDEVQKTMYGMEQITRLCIIALYTKGHVLLEGNPGLGKTALVKALSHVLQLDYSRIQFTPDLMPNDITGVEMPVGRDNGQPVFEFRRGPIFTNLLLADEINRATPKTQSALLEAMAERQVTFGNHSHPIVSKLFDVGAEFDEDDRVFMVLATQNPIDHEGTYELPEAQSDRFMFKMIVPVPRRDVLISILDKDSGVKQHSQQKQVLTQDPLTESMQEYCEWRDLIRSISPSDSVRDHILALFLATNHRSNVRDHVKDGNFNDLEELVGVIEYGLGPRAATALMLGAKAWTVFFNEQSEEPVTNAQGLASVMLPTLRHRLKLRYDWDEMYRAFRQKRRKPDNISAERLRDYYLHDLCCACAPKSNDHARVFSRIMEDIIEKEEY